MLQSRLHILCSNALENSEHTRAVHTVQYLYINCISNNVIIIFISFPTFVHAMAQVNGVSSFHTYTSHVSIYCCHRIIFFPYKFTWNRFLFLFALIWYVYIRWYRESQKTNINRCTPAEITKYLVGILAFCRAIVWACCLSPSASLVCLFKWKWMEIEEMVRYFDDKRNHYCNI